MPSTLLVAVVAIVAVLGGYWFLDEYLDDDTEDAGEAAANAASRARSATETAARGSRYAVVGFAGLGASLAMELLQLGADLNAILGGAPVIIGHVIYGIVSLAGIGGYIPFDKEIAGFSFVFITAIALLLRVSNEPEAA